MANIQVYIGLKLNTTYTKCLLGRGRTEYGHAMCSM